MANGILGERQFLVTAQAMFLLRARSDKEAEAIVMRAMNVGLSLAPVMLGMGVVAETATPQLLQERGLAQKPDLSHG